MRETVTRIPVNGITNILFKTLKLFDITITYASAALENKAGIAGRQKKDIYIKIGFGPANESKSERLTKGLLSKFNPAEQRNMPTPKTTTAAINLATSPHLRPS